MEWFQIISVYLCIVFSLINGMNCFEKNDVNQTSHFASTILQFLDDHVKLIELSKRKDFILLMGDSEAEKIALVLFLSKVELKAVQISFNQFEYTDRYELIEKYAFSIKPELFSDKENGIDYYIMPDWNLTTDTEREIAVSFFSHRILNYANMVKILFIISYSRFQRGKSSYEERQYLRDFITNATHLINVDEFRKGFSMAVTNVDTDSDETDEDKFQMIIDVLIDVRFDFMVASGLMYMPEEQFIDILLISGRIDIFHKANQTGPVDDLPWIQHDRKMISMNLHDNTEYVATKSADFHYSISNASRKYLQKLLEKVQTILLSDVRGFDIEIQRFFHQQEQKLIDLNILHEKMHSGYRIISKMNSSIPILFGEQLLNGLNELGIDIFIHKFETLFNHIKIFEYLKTISENSSSNFEIANGLNNVKEYLEQSSKWYSFIIELNKALSEYEVQKNLSSYQIDVAKLRAQYSIEDYAEKNVDDTNLRKFLERIGSDLYENIHNMTINAAKIRIFKAVLNQNMNKNVDSKCLSNRYSVIGYNVLLSEIVNEICFARASIIDVIALNKLFIDTDVDKTGVGGQFSIIASTWEVIGDRTFNLSGLKGESHVLPSAPSGIEGRPGNPGSPGGHFVGIGSNFINDHKLEIHSNGGDGGDGQHGANGLIL